MIYASIDIGTNSVLLLVAELSGNSINVLKEMESVPRLGKGVDKERNLQPDSIHRVIAVLKQYQTYLEEHFPSTAQHTVVTATSAVRDASNREEFVKLVQKETGWNIRLLSGDEEAQTTYRGALSVLNKKITSENLVFDIGGGSTEIAYGLGSNLKRFISIDMGSVRFTERYINSYPPTVKSLGRMRQNVQLLLSKSIKANSDANLIGVAGTVTSIAAIAMGLKTYDATKLDGRTLGKSTIIHYMNLFASMMPEEIEAQYPTYLSGRGEVIMAGLIIMDEIMQFYNKSEITVSTGGIRHGILLTS